MEKLEERKFNMFQNKADTAEVLRPSLLHVYGRFAVDIHKGNDHFTLMVLKLHKINNACWTCSFQRKSLVRFELRNDDSGLHVIRKKYVFCFTMKKKYIFAQVKNKPTPFPVSMLNGWSLTPLYGKRYDVNFPIVNCPFKYPVCRNICLLCAPEGWVCCVLQKGGDFFV